LYREINKVKPHSKRVEKIVKLHSKRVEKIVKLHSKRVKKMSNYTQLFIRLIDLQTHMANCPLNFEPWTVSNSPHSIRVYFHNFPTRFECIFQPKFPFDSLDLSLFIDPDGRIFETENSCSDFWINKNDDWYLEGGAEN
jgi:hypothetical protein